MVKLINASKMLAAGALVSLSVLVPVRVSADTTNTNFVPNTTSCYAQPITKAHGSDSYTAKWDNANTFTVTVSTPLKADLKLFASSYHLTSTLYNGGCFSRDANSGTYPQTYDGNTQTVVLPKGFSGTQTITVVLPTTCYNEQVDLYTGKIDSQYGVMPLNGPVGQSGHDDYGYVAGNIMTTSLNPTCVGGKGAGPSTPVAPTTPAAPAPAAAPELTNTGLNVRLTSVIAAAILAAAAFVFTRRNKVSE